MELLDRYLDAVRLALFWRGRRDDIIAELRDDLLTRIEAQEEALGRRLTDDEVEAVLKANGHPLVAAARYRERQFLIGPTVLPFYEAAVAGLLALVAVITVLQALISSRPLQAMNGILGAFIPSAISVVGAATIVAVVLERFEVRLGFLENWRPRDLPRFQARGAASGAAGARGRSFRLFRDKTRWESLWELVATLVFLIWWTGAADWRTFWSSHHATVFITEVAPVFDQLYWPILILGVIQALAAAVRFAQPHWTQAGAALDLASAVAGLVLLALIAPYAPWLKVGGAGLSAEQIAHLNRELALVIPICLWVAGAVWAFQAAGAIYRLVRGRPGVHAPLDAA